MACYIPASIPSFWATLGSVLRWCRAFWFVLFRQPMYASPRQVFWTVRPPKRPLHLFPSPRKFPLPLLLPQWPLRWTTLLHLSGGQLVFHAFNSYGKKTIQHYYKNQINSKNEVEDLLSTLIRGPGVDLTTALYKILLIKIDILTCITKQWLVWTEESNIFSWCHV